VNSLSSRMPCSRHNRALSPLDSIASQFFQHFREDQLDVMKFYGDDFTRGFTMVSGGAIEAKAMELEGSPAEPSCPQRGP
jgi:hypothetical protein